VVVDGRLRVTIGRGKDLPSVQDIDPGSAFVARALLSGGPSPVSLIATGETSVLRLPSSAVLSFLNDNPRLARELEQAIDVTELGLRSTGPTLRF